MYINRFVLFILLIIVGSNSFAFDKTRSVTYTVEDGLNRNIVNCFIQDKYGYGWTGTSNGLSRFDGYAFKHYSNLDNYNINSMVIDNESRLWVSANYGLYLYDYISDSFDLIYKGYTHKLSIYDNELYFLIAKKLFKLDDNYNPIKVSNDKISTYLVTDEGIWYSARKKGLQLLNVEDSKVNNRHFKVISRVGDKIILATFTGDLFVRYSSGQIKKIRIGNQGEIKDVKQVNGDIWIATNGNGIVVLDDSLRIKDHIYADINENSSIRSNSINNIYFKDDIVWISQHGGGLTSLSPGSSTFSDYITKNLPKNSSVTNQGYGIYVGDSTCLLGTDYGLSKWNFITNKFVNFDVEKFKKELKGAKIRSIVKDNDYYFIATYDGLLGKYNEDLSLIKTYNLFAKEKGVSYKQEQKINQIFKIRDGKFLIASLVTRNNFILFDSRTEEYKTIGLSSGPVKIQVSSIRRNQSGDIIVLLNRFGLYKYSEEDNSIANLFSKTDKAFNYVLNDFYQDKNGNYYLATKKFGLVKVSTRGDVLRRWTIEDGLNSNTLLRIENNKDKELWISGISGIAKLDLATEKLQLFDNRNGMSANEFSPHSSSKFIDNKFIFGNSSGFTIINPSKVVQDTSKLRVIISDIEFQNNSIKNLKGEKYLKKALEETTEITLPIHRNSFTIKFFAKDNDFTKHNNFAYRLEGLQDEWIYLGDNNHITYTNLSPGAYNFHVKSTNKSNIWNDEYTKLSIIILPPWYQTWWSYLIYFIFLVSIIYFSFSFYRRRLKLKLELDMANFEVEKEHELTEKKMSFFSSISHDLKTFATLISAPVNDLLSMGGLDSDKLKKLNVIKRNAEMLYKLNIELLEYRKITKNKLTLKVHKVDLIPIVRNIFQNFSQECISKNIDYNLDISSYTFDGDDVYVDVEKVERILLNLLSNAIKFTDKGGKVSVEIKSSIGSDEKRSIEIVVSDTGIGFDTKEAKKIFDGFYQVNNSSKQFGGVGIGLYIVKELTNLHHGDISVVSTIGEGSIFTVKLPVGIESFDSSEISTKAWMGKINSSESSAVNIGEIVKNTDVEVPKKKYNQYSIVIVEDNKDLRTYLQDHFSNKNTVFAAKDGKEGLELIKSKNPDIIISDIDMPVMNGYEMCDLVKKDFNTSHIPFILLTGNTELEDKLKGMYYGADNYITKPFEISYVDAVVYSLIDNRFKLREKFMGIEPISSDEKMSAHDIDFINKFKELILENISNPELNIDILVKHFAVSRSQLNRKVKDLVGTTPSNYVKTIRLRKAYELLKEKGSRVSDIAYKTGFSDPNYFTLCFKKEFGKNPSKV